VAAYKIVHCAKRYIGVITEPGCTKKHDHEAQEHGPQEELSGLICINIPQNQLYINVLSWTGQAVAPPPKAHVGTKKEAMKEECSLGAHRA
jgi:hypothetical protein